MTRTRGRAPRGQRLIEKVPHGHWMTTTLIAALDVDGVRCATVVDGAVNGDVFEAFVEQVLVPELEPGDVVIMDNLSSHKRVRTRELIESAGAELVFLPPYSPDLNPIEMVFSKIKQRLRTLACRTKDALWQSMQSVLDTVTPTDAQHCFRHCGYSLQGDGGCSRVDATPLVKAACAHVHCAGCALHAQSRRTTARSPSACRGDTDRGSTVIASFAARATQALTGNAISPQVGAEFVQAFLAAEADMKAV